jgi:hypothetical protein
MQFVIGGLIMGRIVAVILVLISVITIAGCSSPRLRLDPLTKNYGLLSFDHGLWITTVSEETKNERMKNYCLPRNYEIVEWDGKEIAQYQFRTKVLFKCTGEKEDR